MAGISVAAMADGGAFLCRPASGQAPRLEAVQNAADHARCVADRLAGKPHPYGALPWFWSEQGKLRLQIAGLTTGHDQVVVRGNIESGEFSVFLFTGGALAGVEAIGRRGARVST